MPKLTLFIPVYNSAAYLAEAIASVLKQTFEDFELLMIDDGSIDQSLSIMKEYQQKDKRIQVHSRAHKGIPITRNEGLDLARGKYLALMDSDDRIHPDRLAEQISFLDSNKAMLACGPNMKAFGQNASIAQKPTDTDLVKIKMLIAPSINNPTAMMRLDKIKRHNIRYLETDAQAQDYRFWAQVAFVGPITNIDKELYFYRHHASQTSQAHRQNQLRIHKDIVAEILQKLGITLTDKELSLFLLDEFRGEEPVDSPWNLADVFPALVRIFSGLIDINADKNIFDHLKLIHTLCHKYENICLLFGHLGIQTGKRYVNGTIKMRSTAFVYSRLISRLLKKTHFLPCDARHNTH